MERFLGECTAALSSKWTQFLLFLPLATKNIVSPDKRGGKDQESKKKNFHEKCTRTSSFELFEVAVIPEDKFSAEKSFNHQSN